MSVTNVARAGKRGNICVGNNVSATMCPRLPVPLGIVTGFAALFAIHSRLQLVICFDELWLADPK